MTAINNICKEICRWYTENDLVINPKKTEFIIQCKKSDEHITENITLNMNGSVIPTSKKIKSLGLTKDNLSTWTEHITNLNKKCSKLIWILRSLKHKLNNIQLKTLAEALIVSNIKYMILLYGKATKKALQPLNKILKDTFNIVTHGNTIMKEKGEWLNISELYTLTKSTLAYKAVNEMVPDYFKNIVNKEAIVKCSTRRREYETVDTTKCTSMQYEYTVEWSKVPEYIRNAKHTKQFCAEYKKYIIENRFKMHEPNMDMPFLDEVITAVQNLYRNTI
ncbi:unnamed protein product [Orchesella dallaii]|uniref:Uncharacterized protein n=1 Tax=Orchesella dallaii TaxID=48710 RepID=A0ABP1R5J4_9HEXA